MKTDIDMDSHKTFRLQCLTEIANQGQDKQLGQRSLDWLNLSLVHKYSYHFQSLGRPVI